MTTVNRTGHSCAYRKQNSWTRQQVKQNKSSDPLWKHAGFIVAQMDGLQAGVAEWAKQKGKKVCLGHMFIWANSLLYE